MCHANSTNSGLGSTVWAPEISIGVAKENIKRCMATGQVIFFGQLLFAWRNVDWCVGT